MRNYALDEVDHCTIAKDDVAAAIATMCERWHLSYVDRPGEWAMIRRVEILESKRFGYLQRPTDDRRIGLVIQIVAFYECNEQHYEGFIV